MLEKSAWTEIPQIIEENGEEETIRFIEECIKKNYTYVKPIITPRFTPSCTDDYMEKLGKIAKKYNLSVQSHLSETLDEIDWVKQLRPNDNFYGESYDKYGLFGNGTKTIMLIVFIALKQKMI